MSSSSSWQQSAAISVVRNKQKLSNSATGHEARNHSCRINPISFPYHISSLVPFVNPPWERLQSLLGSRLSSWLWRTGRWAEWSRMDASRESVCLCACVCQSVGYLSIFSHCAGLYATSTDLQTPQGDPAHSQCQTGKNTSPRLLVNTDVKDVTLLVKQKLQDKGL